MNPDPAAALRAAAREVQRAHDEIARLRVLLSDYHKQERDMNAHIDRLEALLLQLGRPIHKCQQRTGDSTI